jgi:hypothetical protein
MGPSSADIVMLSCSIVQNSADVGGGVMSFASDLIVSASCFDDNAAVTSCGGVCVEEAAVFSLLQSSISRNMAGSASGGLGVSNSVNVTIESCDFADNRVLAGSGGALHITESTQVQVNGSVFSGNIVQAGSGSAIFAQASLVSVSGNSFSGNEAVGGGGTVFWEHASGMNEPLGVQAGGNVFNESNTASYGPHWATEAHHLRLLGDQEVYVIVDYSAVAPLVGVTLEDVYDQAVVTDSTTTATASV